MTDVISAGGVVYKNRSLLMLKKKNGDWVLPKGRIEKGESIEQTALREVKEETNIDAEIVDYLGLTSYSFSNFWTQHKIVNKKVSWYLMKSCTFFLIPLKSEGFVEAKFVDMLEVLSIARYKDERKVIRKAIETIENGIQIY